MAPYLIDFIDVPVFIVQPNYDAWQVPELLHIQCTKDNTMNSCTDVEVAYIEKNREVLKDLVMAKLAERSFWGAWMPSCIQHW